VQPVKNSSIENVPALAAQLADAGRAAGFRVETYGEVEGCPLLALTRRTPGPRPRIYLSAGMHGDEPAPPLALLELLRRGEFDQRATWFLCPLLNPAGLTRGTRENAGGLDLNRDYRRLRSAEIQAHAAWLRRQPNFDLTLCVHEDWESTGFYLYELNSHGRPTLADAIVTAVSRVFPIDLSPQIDGRDAHGGIIRPTGDPSLREDWPEALYLRAHHSTLGYTLETASALPLDQRIDAHGVAIRTAIAGLLANVRLDPT
jgi:hypothetical protein